MITPTTDTEPEPDRSPNPNAHQVKQVIFEWNTVRPGGAEVSWGSNLDNYSPGYCQHVYHAHNHFQHVYAGDREAMTTDPVTGDYFGGALVGSSGGGVELTLRDGIGAADPSNVGGAVSVLDGTGAGQYRRVVHVSNGTSLRLDAAFDTPLDSTSRVQVRRGAAPAPRPPAPTHPPTHSRNPTPTHPPRDSDTSPPSSPPPYTHRPFYHIYHTYRWVASRGASSSGRTRTRTVAASSSTPTSSTAASTRTLPELRP